MKLVVTYDGQKYESGKPTLKDLVMLERQFSISASKLQDDPRMEYMLFLAFCALRRQGVAVGRYDDAFLDKIEDFESEVEPGDEDEETADPTSGPASDQPTA